MRLDDNPILRTHLTLARRYGLKAAIWATAVLVALVCWAFVEDIEQTRYWSRDLARVAGEYALSITIIQFIVGLLGAVGVARTVANARKNGSLDADRLTPMTPSDLAAGYWLGPLIAPAVLMAFGTLTVLFVSIVTPGVPLGQVLASQAIVYSTVVTVGIVGLWVALEVRNPSLAPGLMLFGLLLSPFSLGFGEVFVGHAFFGFYAFLELDFSGSFYRDSVELLLDPRLLTFALQGAAVWLAWRGVTRKLANPQARGIRFGEAVLAASALAVLQTVIVMPELVSVWTHANYYWRGDDILGSAFVFGAAAVGAAAFAAFLAPDTVRRQVLREGHGVWQVLSRSALSASVIVSIVAAPSLAWLVSLGPDGEHALGVIDLVLTSVIVFSLLEGASVSGERRNFVVAIAVLALACAGPIVLAFALDDDFAMAIPGLSGLLAYVGEWRHNDELFYASLIYHTVLAASGYLFWRKQMTAACARVRQATL